LITTSATSAQSTTPTSVTQTSQSPQGSNLFGNSDFMMMLMAQMRNQNPMDPMDNKDLLGQVTSLNSLQELQSIKTWMQEMVLANQASYAANLLGKNVTADLGNGRLVQGVVSAASWEDGKMMLQVGAQEIPLSAVSEVTGG
jgi:flagellar basal-body rod modification protein FlgD